MYSIYQNNTTNYSTLVSVSDFQASSKRLTSRRVAACAKLKRKI
jgi:hypothetical protein